MIFTTWAVRMDFPKKRLIMTSKRNESYILHNLQKDELVGNLFLYTMNAYFDLINDL